MALKGPATAVVAACVLGLVGVGAARPPAQPAPGVPPLATSAGLFGVLTSTLVFGAADANRDGAVTRDELRTTLEKWFREADGTGAGSVTAAQLIPVLNAAMPMSNMSGLLSGSRTSAGQPRTASPATVEAMMAALPAAAPAKPARPRKVLVLAKAGGFVHSSIPLAARTIEALGAKTGAWSTTISYDAADITPGNLAQYDAVFLASTTGAFLDDPGNADITTARRQALLDFVRGGKGLAGIHAAIDSYHTDDPSAARPPLNMASLFAGFSAGGTLAPAMVSQGDRNGDQKLTLAEVDALADVWFARLDRAKTGKVLQGDSAFLALLIPRPTQPAPQGPDIQIGTWLEFNRMIGGYFKFHFLDPQLITVKIDDPKSPLTAMFRGKPFVVRDEIYTMGRKSWSRRNVHVLTSIDYGKMSDVDKSQEANPRSDGDYGLSWIRRDGQGRVFMEALGHNERMYADKRFLEHILAGVQYAIGDLKADDRPSR